MVFNFVCMLFVESALGLLPLVAFVSCSVTCGVFGMSYARLPFAYI
jgi:hypothetical protein